MRTLRFAVMCSGPVVQRWQAEAIRLTIKNGHQLELIIQDSRIAEREGFLNKLVSYPWHRVVANLCHRYLFHPAAKNPVDMTPEFHGIPILKCPIIKKGYSEYFYDQEIREISSYHLDFIIRFGFHIIRGDILSAAKYGVWSYHHDDEMIYRGGPSGFREILFNDPVNGAILQRLTNDLDNGIVLKKGWFRTVSHSFKANTERLLSETVSWVSQVANDIGNDLPINTEPSNSQAKLFRGAGNLLMVRFLIKLLVNRMRFHFREIFLAEKWSIALLKGPIEGFFAADFWKDTTPRWVPSAPQNSYFADPFMFRYSNELCILAECYSYATQKAGLSCITMFDEENTEKGSIGSFLDSDVHVSYPYLVAEGDQLYCIPESHQNRRVDLYTVDKEMKSLKFKKIMLDDIDAVDPTLFRFNDLWWLFFTRRHLSDTHLWAYYASSIDGEFQSHTNNPVKSDIRGSRPAGTPFIYQGDLYRPAMDCSRTYGWRIAIQKILTLSPIEFAETTVNVIGPDPRSGYPHGIHTISHIDGYFVLDSKRYTFYKSSFIHQIKRRLT